MELIRIEGIEKRYWNGEEEIRALDDLNLKIEEGEFVAIVGPSGSGKSTLMNLLGCLDLPTAGEYYLNGENVAKMSEDHLSRIRNTEIGFVFQGFNLIPTLDALENVELPRIPRPAQDGAARIEPRGAAACWARKPDVPPARGR